MFCLSFRSRLTDKQIFKPIGLILTILCQNPSKNTKMAVAQNTLLPQLQSLESYLLLHFSIFSHEILRIGAKLDFYLKLLSRFLIKAPINFLGPKSINTLEDFWNLAPNKFLGPVLHVSSKFREKI